MPTGAASTHLPAASAPMIWHGWGDPAQRHGLSPTVAAFLTAELGGLGPTSPPVPITSVRLPPSRLTEAQREALAAIVGPDQVHVDPRTRLEHAGGRSTPDLLRRRSGEAANAPDAVVTPDGHAEVVRLLAACAHLDLAVVPFGGGTSVVGGVEPDRQARPAVIAVALHRMDRLLHLDAVSGLARFEPGIRGPAAEARLRAEGFTLGHYPQSYAYLSLGGAVATRSAGQASTGYGRIDDLVTGLRCATPVGELTLRHGQRSAAGPDLRALLIGSEGSLGILTEIEVRVRPAPEVEHYEAFVAPSFASGAATLRHLAQAEAAADVTRLSDAEETRALLAQAGGWQTTALQRYLTVRGMAQPCLLVLGWEGSRAEVTRRRAHTRRLLRRRRLAAIGTPAGRAWAAGRFSAPYLRDDLLDRGILVDTLETATTWAELGGLYRSLRASVADTLADRGTPGLVLTHISHLYPTGASLYLTWLARQEPGATLAQWQAVKTAATEAIVANGGTVTHHHAVGRDHRPWLGREIGPVGVAALRAVKAALDPTGICNPGVLLPPADGPEPPRG